MRSRTLFLSFETAAMSSTFRILGAFSLPALLLALPRPAHSQDDAVFGKKKAEWLKILEKDEKPRMRRAAVLALGVFGAGKSDILPALTKALAEDKDQMVKLQVVTVLENVDPKDLRDSLETLSNVLKKKEESAAVRAGAATLLGKLGLHAKPALATLIAALKESDASIKVAAVEAIGKIGPEAAKPSRVEILPLLKDSDATVRFAALFAYGRFGPDAAFVTPDLNLVLESDSVADVRREAAKTIGRFGPAGKLALASLVKALREDKETDVRRQAAASLGKMGAELKPVAASLTEVLRKDSDRIVRLYIVRSLSDALRGDLKYHVKDLADWLNKDPDSDVRLAIIQELGGLGPAAKEALRAIQEAQGDVVLSVREAAAAALKQIVPPPKKDSK
jgi:HEAT repeat protein